MSFDIINLIGYDIEEKKIIWKNLFFTVGLIIVLNLIYESMFVYSFGWDSWGITSPYIIKTYIIVLAWLGYYTLLDLFDTKKRLSKLERHMGIK